MVTVEIYASDAHASPFAWAGGFSPGSARQFEYVRETIAAEFGCDPEDVSCDDDDWACVNGVRVAFVRIRYQPVEAAAIEAFRNEPLAKLRAAE